MRRVQSRLEMHWDAGHNRALALAAGEGSRLHTLTTTASGVPIPKQFCSLGDGASLLRLREAGEKVLTDCAVIATKADVPSEQELIETVGGQVAAEIARQARVWAADLIVTGTHERRGLRRKRSDRGQQRSMGNPRMRDGIVYRRIDIEERQRIPSDP